MNRFAVCVAAVLMLAACASEESMVVGHTTAMVTVCQSPNDTWQQVLDVAQEECGTYGRLAQFLARDGDCTANGNVSSGYAGRRGTAIHFKCLLR